MPPITPLSESSWLSSSPDLAAGKLARLRELFPDTVKDGELDLTTLKELLGSAPDEANEKFGLSWFGKRQARRAALTPSTGTLLPDRQHSLRWNETKNLLIEGDNLEVLKLLQRSYAGRAKLIYIDPPYNTGTDLVYPNNYQEPLQNYLTITGQLEGGSPTTSNPFGGGRYHSNWLSMMYSRLLVARNLLSNDGVLIVTIDEHELANLGCLLAEVFEEGTFEHACISIVHNPRGVQGGNFSYNNEYAYFVYRAGSQSIGQRRIAEDEVAWTQFRNWGTESERHDARNCFYPILVQDGQVTGFGNVSLDNEHPQQTVVIDGVAHVYPLDRSGVERKWRYARQSVDSVRDMLRARLTDYGYEIEVGKTSASIKTVWTDSRYDANQYGSQILKGLVPDSPFTFPKSLWAVYDCLEAVVGNDKEAIIIDFFAGSGTTGHAVYELNKRDAGSRRFILVQLPEPIPQHARFSHIAEVTAERLRAAATSISSDGLLAGGDLGFRVYKLATSNLKAWDPGPDLATDLLDAADNLTPGRTDDDLLVELLLKRGVDLVAPVQTRTIAGRAVQVFGGGVLVTCLADVSVADAEALAGGIAECVIELNPPAPAMVIFKDGGFESDVAKANIDANLRQRLNGRAPDPARGGKLRELLLDVRSV